LSKSILLLILANATLFSKLFKMKHLIAQINCRNYLCKIGQFIDNPQRDRGTVKVLNILPLPVKNSDLYRYEKWIKTELPKDTLFANGFDAIDFDVYAQCDVFGQTKYYLAKSLWPGIKEDA